MSIQAAFTGLIGALLCFFRMKIRNCTTLSLIIGHGIYDAMITVWGCETEEPSLCLQRKQGARNALPVSVLGVG